MAEPKTLCALIGFHDETSIDSTRAALERKGYDVASCSTPEGLMEYLPKREYGVVIMDVNLGAPGGIRVQPFLATFEALKGGIEAGKTRLMGLSGSDSAIKAAIHGGVPEKCVTSKRSFNLNSFLG